MDTEDLNKIGAAVEEFTAQAKASLDKMEDDLKSERAEREALEIRLNRMGVGGGPLSRSGVDPVRQTSERKAVSTFVRSEIEHSANCAELKALSVGSDPDGGYIVLPALSDSIQQKVFDVSPMARFARRVSINTGDAFEEPWDVSDIGGAWVGESEARPTTATPQLNYLRWPVREIYTNQPVTQRLLDDSRFDIGGWLDGKISEKFSRSEGNAYISGNGVLRPKGILQYDVATTGDATRPFGTLQYIPTGDASGFVTASSSVSPADCLFNVVYSLRPPYRPNARWLMNLATAGVVRKFKDSEGRFVWADAREGQPATLCGFPVDADEEMPNVGSNAFPIAFGDFQQGYLIVEKPGLRMQRDPYTQRPNVLFYAYRRVGGGLQNSEALKLLKIST